MLWRPKDSCAHSHWLLLAVALLRWPLTQQLLRPLRQVRSSPLEVLDLHLVLGPLHWLRLLLLLLLLLVLPPLVFLHSLLVVAPLQLPHLSLVAWLRLSPRWSHGLPLWPQRLL